MKCCYLGIDLGGTNIKAAVFDAEFQKLGESRVPTCVQEGTSAVLHRMEQAARTVLADAGVSLDAVECMGIGVPGLLDRKAGLSLFSPNFPGWENVPVKEWFENCLGIPVFIDNDVRMNLYGEWKFGAGRGKENLVLLTLGTGLGSGVVMDGRALYGATDSAGEIGHMNVYYENGRPCRCGSSGCLGRYVSALGLLRTVREKLSEGRESLLLDWAGNDPEQITAKMVSDAYDAGDSVAVEGLRETGEILGLGLVNVINLYNPELVIIGGGMCAAGERLLAPARELVNRRALKISRAACSIVTAQLGDGAGMLGAAVYGAQQLAESKKDCKLEVCSPGERNGSL